MKHIAVPAVLAGVVFLGACGGGGGSGGSASVSPAPTPPAQPEAPHRLAAYFGTWLGPCVSDQKLSYTISRGTTPDTVTIATKILYYDINPAYEGCRSEVLMTGTFPVEVATHGAKVAATYSTVSGSSTWSTAEVDKIVINRPAFSMTVSGPGVRRVEQGGQVSWCNDAPGGPGGFCVPHIQSTTARLVDEAWLADGSRMYMMTRSGRAEFEYYSNPVLTRQP